MRDFDAEKFERELFEELEAEGLMEDGVPQELIDEVERITPELMRRLEDRAKREMNAKDN